MNIDIITLTASKNYTDKQIEKASNKGADLSRYVQTVNGIGPDENGNVEVTGGSGAAGIDGFSPIASVTQTDSGAVISITDKSGATTATINNGKDGKDGSPGSAGKDGTSVTVKSVSESTADGGSNVVTFSDGKTVTIKNGSKGSKGDPGYTPVRGTDYWTAADQSAIIEQVIADLGGTPVFGVVDANNNIILSGNLADGIYTLKYEDADGKVTEIP